MVRHDQKEREKGGGWPSSLRMANGGGNGEVRRRPEPLGHHRWTGGIEGGAVEERAWHLGANEGDGAKKGNDDSQRLLWRPGGAGRRGKKAGGPELKGGGRVAVMQRGEELGGSGHGTGHEVKAAMSRV
jgi:hypothetical protein